MSTALHPTSSLVESLDATSQSPLQPCPRQHVFFSPTQRIDFIVHFGQTDFHCHTFVLHTQSAYFRHVLDALTPSSSLLSLPPPVITLSSSAAADDGAKSVIDLCPVSSPTSSSASPPQPVWRSVLDSATSLVQSALQRLTLQPESSRAKRKRELREDGGDSDEVAERAEATSTNHKRRTRPANLTVPTLAPSPFPSPSSNLPETSPAPCRCNPVGLSCVHIPSQRTIISGEEITDGDFDLFFRHLYYAAHYRYPPFLPADDLDLTASPPPAVTLPPYPPLAEQMTSTLLRARPPKATTPTSNNSGGSMTKLVWKEALLTLGQYFACELLLARCEAVGMRRLERVGHAGAYFDVLYAQQYGMREWKWRCIELILTDKRMKQRKEHALTVLWERQLLLDMLAVDCVRLQSGGKEQSEKQQFDKADLLRAVERAMKGMQSK